MKAEEIAATGTQKGDMESTPLEDDGEWLESPATGRQRRGLGAYDLRVLHPVSLVDSLRSPNYPEDGDV